MASNSPELPPEIWSQIFSLSCVDDGFTGRSLSSVSHQFRQLSSRYKHQSLALTTTKQIVHFSSVIDQLEASQKRVLYLFIYYPPPLLDAPEDVDDPDVDFVMDSGSSSDSSSSSVLAGHPSAQAQSLDAGDAMDVEEDFIGAEERAQLLAEAAAHIQSLELAEANDDENDDDDENMDEATEMRHKELDDIDNIVTAALYALLQKVGDTLQILSLVWTSIQPRLTEELLPPLPGLRELYLSRDFTELHNTEPMTDDPVDPLFPSLQYLQIAGYVEQRPEDFAMTLAILTPSLTHLRVPSYFFL
jgi:hypothetical protein